jgi:DNA repair protein RadD
MNNFSEWQCFEHSGMARIKAENWWRRRAPLDKPPPATVGEALAFAEQLISPRKIEIKKNGKFTEVVGYVF